MLTSNSFNPLENKTTAQDSSKSMAHVVWHWLWRNGRLAVLFVSFFIMQAGVERTTTGLLRIILLMSLVIVELGLLAYWEVFSEF